MMCFSILYILNSLHLLLLFTFCQVCLPVNETADSAEIETEMDGSRRNVHHGPGKHMTKTRFGLGKSKENEQNYQRLLLHTVLPLSYFMV